MELHIFLTGLFWFILIVAIAFCVARWVFWFKQKKVEKDLIYLEFLIQHGMKDPVSKRNIFSIITDYLTKKEYQGKRFDKCCRLFNEKYGS
jgi:hypothetical protein